MAPRFTRQQVAGMVADQYGFAVGAEPLSSERDQNYILTDAQGKRLLLKIANARETYAFLDFQNQLIEFLGSKGLALEFPRIIANRAGEKITLIAGEGGKQHFIRLLSWIEGICFANVRPPSGHLLASLGRALAEMDRALLDFSHPAAHRRFHWDIRQADMAFEHLPLLPRERRGIVEGFFANWRKIDWAQLRSSVIQNDANDYNILVQPRGEDWRLAAVVDYGDAVHTATICELAIALAYVMLERKDPIATAAQVVAGYHQVYPLTEPEVEALYSLAVTRLCCSVCYAEYQKAQAPENEYLNISNASAWKLLEALSGRPAEWPQRMFRYACGLPVSPDARRAGRRSRQDILDSRRSHLGPSLSLAYRSPLHIIGGSRQYLYDADGRRYLDCVNNVAHVGHSHPIVVEAVYEQMALLNTNTRYLHENLVEYCERLTAKFSPPLSVVFLVGSGSEANELALRLARAHTGQKEVIVLDFAYHGNTSSLIELSPYKCEGPGGGGLPPYAHKVPMPDVYRGPHRGADAGELYASYIARAAGASRGLAALFCESALSCGGQIVLPPGYLAEAYRAVRAAGGVCVADEVQTGFGRSGSHFWGYETQGVVPDIVTLGKPIGNGFPLGAVITTAEIARSFANGMEYFNTFGGNPVACAAGLAVLDVIRDADLQKSAHEVGNYLRFGLRQLQAKYSCIGDVRGIGLFLGIELVRDPDTLEAADREAARLVEDMKQRGILLSTDGPLHNVIKIKPPLVFSEADAGCLLAQLEDLLKSERFRETPAL
jgi:4-aminobutyrate aminotransferase-like enzyme/Ser/Thr protein kinase RdoA (MazF antagonist)